MYVVQLQVQHLQAGHVLHAGTHAAGKVARVVHVYRAPRRGRRYRHVVLAYTAGGRLLGAWPAGQLVRVAHW